jgi:hypothetical protein
MAKLTQITIPLFRIQREELSWGHEYYVQKRQGNGRWKRESDNYGHITSAKAKLGNLILELIAEAEEE